MALTAAKMVALLLLVVLAVLVAVVVVVVVIVGIISDRSLGNGNSYIWLIGMSI